MGNLLNISLIICFLSFALTARKNESESLYIRLWKNPFIIIVAGYIVFSIVVLMTANREGYDVRNFIILFDYVKKYGKNPFDYTYTLFAQLINFYTSIFKEHSYFMFHAIIVIICGILVIWSSRNYISNIISVCFLYLLSGTYAVDGMQFKNFISVCILVCAIPLLCNEEYKNNLKFVLLILIASCFHFSFVLYLFLLIVNTKWFKNIKMVIPIIGLVIYSILFIGGTKLTSNLLDFLALIPGMGKLASYSLSFVGKRSLVPVLIYILILAILYFGYQSKSKLTEPLERYVELIYDIWLLMGIILPFLIYANAAYRIFRNLYIPIFIVMCNFCGSFPRLRKKRILFSIAIIGCVLLIYFYPIMLGQYVDVYQPVIEGKYFWIE